MLTLAQAPTGPRIFTRGVANAFAQDPAPSTAAPGSLITIRGLNLGPAEGITAPAGETLPETLGDVSVRINTRPAPVAYASPSEVIAQVPWEIPAGMATVVVRRTSGTSNVARINVANIAPGVRTKNGAGYGEAAGLLNGRTVKLTATGFGPTDPRVTDGSPGSTDSPVAPRMPVRVYVGGVEVSASAAFSATRAGEFDVAFDAPDSAQPGDVVNVLVNNREANRTTLGAARDVSTSWVTLPGGAAELRDIMNSDLRPGFAVANGARDSNGCYPAYIIDAKGGTAKPIEGCLTHANRNAVSPFVQANGGTALAALIGPPAADSSTGVSKSVLIVDPAKDAPMKVDLPSAAQNLTPNGANFVAVLAGTPPRPVQIDAATGEITDIQPAANPGGAGAGAALNLLNFKIDLGDGLTQILAFAASPDGIALVVGNNADQPTKAKLAAVNVSGEVLGTRDFPAGWLPLVAPANPNQPAGGGPAGGAARPLVPRVAVTFEGATRSLYVMARAADGSKDALIEFTTTDANVLSFPEGWHAASCTPNIALLQLELTQRIALLGSRAAEKDFKQVCPANGFIVVDYAAKKVDAVALQGQDQFNATAGFGDFNDFLFGSNTDPTRRGLSDTLYVLDGVTGSLFAPFAAPASVTGFSAVTPIAETNWLVAVATSRVAGDEGFLVFDLDSGTMRRLYVPDGFASVQLVDLYPTTRKLVAKGNKANNAGSQYIVYDLLSEESVTVPNPDGVAFVGSVPVQAQPGQPGQNAAPVQLQRTNRKANSIEAVGFTADRKQSGVFSVRIP